MPFSKLFFSADGRISRSEWWLGAVIIALSYLLAEFFLPSLFGAGIALKACAFTLTLCTIVVSHNLARKRLQDRARAASVPTVIAAIWAIHAALAIVQITDDPRMMQAVEQIFLAFGIIAACWCAIELGCRRGTIGANAHGRDPVPALAPRRAFRRLLYSR